MERTEKGSSCSFVDSITKAVGEVALGSSNQLVGESKIKAKGAIKESIVRDGKSRNKRLHQSSVDLTTVNDEEEFLSVPDPGFLDDDEIDLLVEALSISATMHSRAGNFRHNPSGKSINSWSCAKPEHSLGLLHEKTIRASK